MARKTIRNIPQQRAVMPTQDPVARAHNFAEVALGFDLANALVESERCLVCPNPNCVPACPVNIDIPGFIVKISEKDYRGAYDILTES
ncbi:MAG: dihydropyrimidine dehydrogenase, partial [Gammaproteobacteria bacterium]|nr:dihydropyrimidine dehydrogenase [Gammaproteobacteria bacterium]